MKTVLVTGASGLIGQHLCKDLAKRGYDVRVLGRKKRQNSLYTQFVWNIAKSYIDMDAVRGVNFIIHLAGANISEGRWTDDRKQEIKDSRVISTELLLSAVIETDTVLDAFISSSAIGYYGAQTVKSIFLESDNPAKDFIGKVCLLWELAASQFEKRGIRTVKLRTGVVLTSSDGPLAKMLAPIKWGVGSGLGKGSQYIPWIHINDLVGIYVMAMEENEMTGPYNAVAPEHLTNLELTKSIAKAVNRKVRMPNIPDFLLKLIFGEMAVIFLEGSRVSADRIQRSGFQFKHPNAEQALKDLLA
jgi:uncharacterized protein